MSPRLARDGGLARWARDGMGKQSRRRPASATTALFRELASVVAEPFVDADGNKAFRVPVDANPADLALCCQRLLDGSGRLRADVSALATDLAEQSHPEYAAASSRFFLWRSVILCRVSQAETRVVYM